MKIFFVTFLLNALATAAFGAACCGPTAGIPSLLTSGEKWKFQAGYARTDAVADVGNSGLAVFRRSQDQRTVSLATFEAVTEVWPSWQLGAAIGQGLDGRVGDTSLQVMQETLPEVENSFGAFRIFSFAQIVFPTGRSLEELQTVTQDPTGEGRGSVAAGGVLIRRGWADDEFTSLRLRRFQSRSFDDGLGIGESNKIDFAVGAGYSRGSWRGGGAVRAEYETSKAVTSEGLASGAGENYRFPVNVSLSYFFVGGAMVQVQYTDDTILGPVKNIVLGRTLGLGFAQRFY